MTVTFMNWTSRVARHDAAQSYRRIRVGKLIGVHSITGEFMSELKRIT